MSDDLREMRNDIKDLSIQVARLSQKIEDLQIPGRPCDYFVDHINTYHKNTLGEYIKQQAITTIVTVTIIACIGYLWVGFAVDVNKDKSPVAATEDKK